MQMRVMAFRVMGCRVLRFRDVGASAGWGSEQKGLSHDSERTADIFRHNPVPKPNPFVKQRK